MSSEIVDIKIRRVHDGVGLAATKVPVPCNAYCQPPIHCDLLYIQTSNPIVAISHFQSHFPFMLRGANVKVIRIEKASEAPEKPPGYHIQTGIEIEGEPLCPWLVFWKIDD